MDRKEQVQFAYEGSGKKGFIGVQMISKKAISDKVRPYLRNMLQFILLRSLNRSCREQGLQDLAERLEAIVPNIGDQYSTVKLDTPYLIANVRYLHAFQISLIDDLLNGNKKTTIVDIGDSSGTHLQYILGLHPDKAIECLSVNVDPEAVDKIRLKGLNAVCARAEDLDNYSIQADIVLCFETLEHLMDPCGFLHGLSKETHAKYLVITVPFLRCSRVGLHHIRHERTGDCTAENTHIFELSPDDWALIIKHSGWSIKARRVYLQYPRKSLLRLTRNVWKRYDFEGFLGMVLIRNDSWSTKYTGW